MRHPVRIVMLRQRLQRVFTSPIVYRTALAATILVGSEAQALPTGGQVESGNITFQQPNNQSLVVNQASDRAIINWTNFDIMSGESTHFVQPNANSIALNRITDGNPTQILGTLSANGRLVLVNPNGVFFGAGSQVDVAGLVASTAVISSQNFLSGNLKFDQAGSPYASIVNQGNITAADGGLVALVAPSVRNDGIIQANMGTVALGAGTAATIDMYGDHLYSFAVTGENTSAGLGPDGSRIRSEAINNGTINAAAGRVYLTARAAKDIVSNVVNNTGIIEASSAHIAGGEVILDTGDHGTIHVGGSIHSGDSITLHAGDHITFDHATLRTNTGKVAVTGKKVTLLDSSIHAGQDIQIDNTGAFYSNTADVLSTNAAGTGKVSINQTQDGSIQNAINAIGNTGAGGGQVTLLSGIWNEQVVINQSNFTLAGQGASSIIRAPEALVQYGAVTPVIYADNVANVRISDLVVNGAGRVNAGIVYNQTSGSAITGTEVYNSNGDGIQALFSGYISLVGNQIHDVNGRGIFASGLSVEPVEMGNRAATQYNRFSDNHLYNIGADGIYLETVANAFVSNNHIHDVSHNGISGYGLSIAADTGAETIIADNKIHGIGNDGIHVEKVTNANITGNEIFALGHDGIFARALRRVTSQVPALSGLPTGTSSVGQSDISGNRIYYLGHDGIHLDDVQNAQVTNNEIHDLSHDGIFAANLYVAGRRDPLAELQGAGAASGQPYQSIFSANILNGIGHDGIHLEATQNAYVSGNNAQHITHDAIYASGASLDRLLGDRSGSYANALFDGNNIYSTGRDGIHLDSMHGASVTNSVIDQATDTAIHIVDSKQVALTNNLLSNALFAIHLDHSLFARIAGNNIAAPSSGVGLLIANGSGGTTVSTTAFNGGSVGIALDGVGSSMAFEGNGSSFTGQDFYFTLTNGAMSGQTLIASEQLFDGTRASQFTQTQLGNAEARTIDKADDLIPGDVFYRDNVSTSSANPLNFAVLDDFQNSRKNFYRRGNFSYAGRVFNFRTDTIEPNLFNASAIKLSLLNPVPVVPSAVDISRSFAALAPASGTANPTDPKVLANLSPSAGGPDIKHSDSLSSRAGDVAVASCGNSFLGDGYTEGFNCAANR